MATLRTLVTELRLKATDAVKGLKAYDRLWKTVAKSVEASAGMVERSADRAVAALTRMGDAAAVARASAGAAAQAATTRPTGGGGGRGGGGGQRSGGHSSPVIDSIVARGAKVAAAQGGLAAGSKPITAATDALGRFATASERARAKVTDLTSQVARNREEVARLKRQAVETGDAEALLAGRMRGLAVATLDTTAKLQHARRELRGVEGGLLDAVKAAGGFRAALSTAAGNVLAGVGTRVVGGLAAGVHGAAEAAMDFEKKLVDVRKVAKGLDDTDEGFARIKDGIKAASTDLGVMPDQVAALTAQLTAGFTDGRADLVELTKDVTKIGVAWDITGAQAGEYFKQTSAGLQLEAEETKQLFGTYNELSNAFGIQAKDIAEAMTRSAGLLKGANLSGELGAALNATLIKTGASAEVAATGVKTFVRSVGAGATEHQIKAFKDLGLSMETVRANLASGDPAKARKEIEGVVKALDELGKTHPEKRLEAMVNLFGSESIGSIGAAATATKLLGQAFDIAGNKAAALSSVQKEYDRVSNTTAARVAKLKANVGVLAIEFGERLLPKIDEIVGFLTSEAGKEWAAGAVEHAADVVVTLASALSQAAQAFAWVAENIGLTNVGIAAMAIRLAALAGPWGLVGLAATAALAAISRGIGEVLTRVPLIGDVINDTRNRLVKMAAEDQARQLAAKVRVEGDKAYEDRGGMGEGGGRGEGPTIPTGPAPMASGPGAPGGDAGGGGGDPAARFDALVAKRNAGQLKPSEAKELRQLSKSQDRPIPPKPGKRRHHKQTKMDRQLAAIDPSVRGVLTRGGEKDRGGDLMVAGNALDKAVLDRSSRARGMGGVEGVGGVGPGPNITNHYTYINTNVQQEIDARGPGNSSENLAGAGQQVAADVAGAIRFTGADRLKAARLSGGVRRGPV